MLAETPGFVPNYFAILNVLVIQSNELYESEIIPPHRGEFPESKQKSNWHPARKYKRAKERRVSIQEKPNNASPSHSVSSGEMSDLSLLGRTLKIQVQIILCGQSSKRCLWVRLVRLAVSSSSHRSTDTTERQSCPYAESCQASYASTAVLCFSCAHTT